MRKEKVLVARVKRRLQRTVSALETCQRRLLDTANLLPPLPQEADRDLDLNQMDETTELRMVILCVSHDSLRPAIADLRAVAEPGQDRSDG